MKLTVVIVNYNVRYFLEQCLLSVERAMTGICGEVYVVDNDSTDDSIEYLRKKFPWVQYIENNQNLGFSKANNIAISKARGEYVLLLNPDTFVGEDTLYRCIDFMDAHQDAGACGVYMERTDGSFALESRRGVPTPFTAFCKMSGLGALFPRSKYFGRYYMQYLDVNKASEIDIVSGAFMFIRKSALDKVGLLDETFFMYGEDIDLSYRILQAGYKNYYIPTPILHYKGESTKKGSIRYVNAFHQAMAIFFRKHFSRDNFFYELIMSAVIYTKAGMTYLKYKMIDFGGVDSCRRRERYLLVGYGDNLSQMAAIVQRNGIDYDMLSSVNGQMPTADVLIDKYDCIVFDLDRFLFSSILEFFRHCGRRKRTTEIGTYMNSSKSIIVMRGAMN